MDLLSVNDVPGQHAPSWYSSSANPCTDYPSLDSDNHCDVCIIGGGFTGLSAALHLAQRGFKVTLLEANKVGWGASGRNGGQVGSGQRCDQWTLEKRHGEDTARQLWNLSVDACELVRELITKHNIQCDYQPGVLEATVSVAEQHEAESYAEHLTKHYNHTALDVFDRNSLQTVLASESYSGGLLDSSAGHCHPLNYATGLGTSAAKAGAELFENSRVTAIEYNTGSKHALSDTASTQTLHRITTERGSVTAPTIVFACNGYLGDLHKDIAKRVMPINNYIVATEPLGDALASSLIKNNMAVADSLFVVNYFRLSNDGRLLFGGGESWGYRFPQDIRALVRPRMLSIFPQLETTALDYAWGGTLAITRTRMPCYREIASGLYSASGYSGHGVAMATLSGKLISDAIAGEPDSFNLMASLPAPAFPGNSRLRQPLLAAAMGWYALRDRSRNWFGA